MDYNFMAFLDKKSQFYPFTKDEFEALKDGCAFGEFKGHLELRLEEIKKYKKEQKAKTNDSRAPIKS